MLLAPHFFRWPVTVSINGTTTQVSYGTTLSRAALGTLDRSQLYGDLLSVDGEVFESYGGQAPVFYVNGSPRDGESPVRRKITISVERGADTVEASDVVQVAVEPELNRRGTGPLRQVVEPGSVGIIEQTVGRRSGVIVDARELTAAQPVTVSQLAYSGETKIIALTFDDGPHPVHTPELLDLLSELEVSATFFVTGLEVRRNPAIAQRIVAEGHQIANHSYGHPNYTNLDYDQKREDFLSAQDRIEDATGIRPAWVRPPYGLANSSTYSMLGSEMLIAHWTIDPVDWRRPGTGSIHRRVVERAHPGAIVLLHDGGGNREQTVSAVRLIIEDLREEGYRFVTVAQLYSHISE